MSNIRRIENIDYNSKFLCTYKSFDEEYYSNLCYQIQLLQAFNIMKYDEFILNSRIENCFHYLSTNEEIKNILDILSEKYKNTNLLAMFSNGNKIILFQLLFSFNYFDLFHKCLSEYLNDVKSNNSNKDSNSNKNRLYFSDLNNYIRNEE